MKRDDLQKILLANFGHLDDRQLLALTIYGESRGEGREGMIAVGSVILERVDHRVWDGETIREVCLMPYQFSCYLPSDPNYGGLLLIARNFLPHSEKSISLLRCYMIAWGLLEDTIPRTPIIAEHHVTQYCTPAVNPTWKQQMKLVARIGGHEFYA